MHWSRWRNHGDPNREKEKITGPCDAPRCSRDASIRINGGKYCNKHYQRLYTRGSLERAERRRPKPLGACTVDGCDKKARSANSPYCEMHYCRIRRNGSLDPVRDVNKYDTCQYCGTDTEGGKKYCSVRCSARDLRGTPRERECLVCGSSYDPANRAVDGRIKGRDRMVCSDECDRLRAQDCNDKRRPISGLTHVGRAIRYKVFSRDNWICQICGQPTDRESTWPDPWYPTIDHIVPVAHGGDHTLGNLQCAHASCNCRKHAKLPSQFQGYIEG